MRLLLPLLALTAGSPAIAQTVTIPNVTVSQYIAPARLDVATGQLHATPSAPPNLACPGIVNTPPAGPFVHLGSHYIPVSAAPQGPTLGVIVLDGVVYAAGLSPVEISNNGTVIPDPGFTQCRRANGSSLPASSAVVFYGPNTEVMFLNSQVAARYDTSSTPYRLVLTSSSGDAVCTPITPPSPVIFTNGYE